MGEAMPVWDQGVCGASLTSAQVFCAVETALKIRFIKN